MPETVILKKYTNRRLYNTEKSCYVTLQQVAEIIKANRQVKVIDAKTKDDVTAFILTQIVLEETKNNNILLPATVLHLMIQYGDNILNDFFTKHLHQTINYYLNARTSFESQFHQWIDLSMDFSGITPKSFIDIFSKNKLKDL